MRRLFGGPERIENAVVKLTMDGAAYNRLKDELETVGFILNYVENSDTVNLEYKFKIEYYNMVAALRSLIVLLNDPSVKSAMIGSRDELNLLFVELIDTIRTVQQTLDEMVPDQN